MTTIPIVLSRMMPTPLYEGLVEVVAVAVVDATGVLPLEKSSDNKTIAEVVTGDKGMEVRIDHSTSVRFSTPRLLIYFSESPAYFPCSSV
jgi:hypothetical protein